MAIASSLFSPKSLMDRFRSPVFIASALSLGAHGVFFAAMPMLSASEDLQDKEESVPVVALSAEEAQRLPDAVRNSSSSALFGNDPFFPQDGSSLLPVPGIPPYGDLIGLDSSFNDPLQTTPPLWGSPIDIFQDSLPAFPGETSVIFPDTNAFDTFGNKPFDIPLDGPANASNNNAPFLGNDPAIAAPEETDKTVASQDQPLIEGSNEVPGSGFNPPIVANREGTNVNNAFGGESASPAPVNPDQLASGPQAGEEPAAPEQSPGQSSRPVAGNDPALLALQAEQQRLRNGYRNNGSGAANIGQVAAELGQLVSEKSLALKPAQALVAQYPDPSFKCPADSLPALLTLVTQKDGSILAPQLVQSTQYPALDTAAQEAAATFAADLTEPGIYQLRVTFQDEAGRCKTQDALS